MTSSHCDSVDYQRSQVLMHCFGAGNTASQVAAAVFKWERLLVGNRASMHFYAEFTPKVSSGEPKQLGAEADSAQTSSSVVNGTPAEGEGVCFVNIHVWIDAVICYI